MTDRLQSILTRRNAEVAQSKATRASKAAENRARMPFTASMVDELNAAGLGPCKVVYARENGIERGRYEPGVPPILEQIKSESREPKRVRKTVAPRSERWYEEPTDE